MFSILLDIEVADDSFVRDLGVFIDEKMQGYSFRYAKKDKPTKQFCCADLCGAVEIWITKSFPAFFREIKLMIFFQTKHNYARFLPV